MMRTTTKLLPTRYQREVEPCLAAPTLPVVRRRRFTASPDSALLFGATLISLTLLVAVVVMLSSGL